MKHEPDWASGPYAAFMAGRPAAGATLEPLAGLLRPERLEALLLKGYGAELMASQLAVLVSQWSKFYFMQLMPQVLVSRLVQGWRWPLDLAAMRVQLGERGWIEGLRLGEGGGPCDPQDGQWPLELIDSNLRPLIEALSLYGAVAPGVLWGNAGDYLEQQFKRLQALGAPGLAPVEALLAQPRLADERPNPLYAPIRYRDDGRRQRRSCCLSYRVDWVGHCEHCPLVG